MSQPIQAIHISNGQPRVVPSQDQQMQVIQRQLTAALKIINRAKEYLPFLNDQQASLGINGSGITLVRELTPLLCRIEKAASGFSQAVLDFDLEHLSEKDCFELSKGILQWGLVKDEALQSYYFNFDLLPIKDENDVIKLLILFNKGRKCCNRQDVIFQAKDRLFFTEYVLTTSVEGLCKRFEAFYPQLRGKNLECLFQTYPDFLEILLNSMTWVQEITQVHIAEQGAEYCRAEKGNLDEESYYYEENWQGGAAEVEEKFPDQKEINYEIVWKQFLFTSRLRSCEKDVVESMLKILAKQAESKPEQGDLTSLGALICNYNEQIREEASHLNSWEFFLGLLTRAASSQAISKNEFCLLLKIIKQTDFPIVFGAYLEQKNAEIIQEDKTTSLKLAIYEQVEIYFLEILASFAPKLQSAELLEEMATIFEEIKEDYEGQEERGIIENIEEEMLDYIEVPRTNLAEELKVVLAKQKQGQLQSLQEAVRGSWQSMLALRDVFEQAIQKSAQRSALRVVDQEILQFFNYFIDVIDPTTNYLFMGKLVASLQNFLKNFIKQEFRK